MDDNLTPAFRQGRDNMKALRLDNPLKTSYEDLIRIQEFMGLTFEGIDECLGLDKGSFQKWVAAARREGPQPN